MPLETLPAELKLSILRATPDIATLSAIVHASPTYHAIYLFAREECLTQATLKDLLVRYQGGFATPLPKALHKIVEAC